MDMGDKDPAHVERGLRGALHNPHVSEAAKERDRQILEKEFHEDLTGVPGGAHPGQTTRPGPTAETTSMGTTGHHIETRSSRYSQSSEEGKDPEHVARGLKAALHNPNVSEEAKEHDRRRLGMMEKVVGE